MTTGSSPPDRATGGHLRAPVAAVCFDWGGTLMADDGPAGTPMALWPRVTVIPGAADCLATLHGLLPLAIATNATDSGRAMIERALDRGGLLPFVAEIFCFTEVGVSKGDPRFWSAVCERLELPPDRIVMVGDSLEQDVLAPRRGGLQAVWFNPGGRHPAPPEPVPTVTSLAGVTEMIRSATTG